MMVVTIAEKNTSHGSVEIFSNLEITLYRYFLSFLISLIFFQMIRLNH